MSRSTKIAFSQHVIFDIVKPFVHDGSMEVDKTTAIVKTNFAWHGPRHSSSPRLQPVFSNCELLTTATVRGHHRPLKDNWHENIKWNPCNRFPREATKQRDMVVKTRRRQRAGVSPRGDLCYDSWSLSPLSYKGSGTTPVVIKLDHNWSCS